MEGGKLVAKIIQPIYEKGCKDSGERQYFETGAVRDIQTGKGRFDLISPVGERRLAVRYEEGAKKYGDRNWQKGIPIGRCLDSAKRHINEYLAGDISEDHLAAAAWNIFTAMDMEENNHSMQDIDTRPDYKRLHATPKVVEDIEVLNPCLECDGWDSDREGCTMASVDKNYACPREKEEKNEKSS